MMKKILLLLLLWQITGVVFTVIVAFPYGSFHVFIHQLMMWMSLTNLTALLCGLYSFLYLRFISDGIDNAFIRNTITVSAVSLIIAVSVFVAMRIGVIICGFDDFEVNKWHLMFVILNIVVLTAVTAAIVLYFLHRKLTMNLAEKIREHEKLKRLQVESRLSLLQSRTNPHFLFNTLNTLLDIVNQNTDEVEKIIMNLSDIYRTTLTITENELVSLDDELDLVTKYLEVEKIRMGDRLRYSFHVDNEVRSCKIPPMIIQILVENAVIHGITPKIEGGSIIISAIRDNGRIVIDINDDGTGIIRKKETKGFGLYSIQQRIKLQYGDAGKMIVTSPDSGGTQVRIELPYETENHHS